MTRAKRGAKSRTESRRARSSSITSTASLPLRRRISSRAIGALLSRRGGEHDLPRPRRPTPPRSPCRCPVLPPVISTVRPSIVPATRHGIVGRRRDPRTLRRCPASRSTACASSTSPRWCPGRTAPCSSSDFGADVVKVEAPGGDVARDLGPRAHDGHGRGVPGAATAASAASCSTCRPTTAAPVWPSWSPRPTCWCTTCGATRPCVAAPIPPRCRAVNPDARALRDRRLRRRRALRRPPRVRRHGAGGGGHRRARRRGCTASRRTRRRRIADKVAGMAAAFAIAAALRKRELDGAGAGDRGADGRAHGVVRSRGAPLGPRVRAAARRSALPTRVDPRPVARSRPPTGTSPHSSTPTATGSGSSP